MDGFTSKMWPLSWWEVRWDSNIQPRYLVFATNMYKYLCLQFFPRWCRCSFSFLTWEQVFEENGPGRRFFVQKWSTWWLRGVGTMQSFSVVHYPLGGWEVYVQCNLSKLFTIHLVAERCRWAAKISACLKLTIQSLRWRGGWGEGQAKKMTKMIILQYHVQIGTNWVFSGMAWRR